MTIPRGDAPYEVPIGRLAGGGAARRRAGAVAAVVVTVVGGAIALSAISNAGPAGIGPSAAVAIGSGSILTAASAAPKRPIGARVEQLLTLPNAAVAGAPAVDIIERDGADLLLDRWTAGAGLTVVRRVPGALTGLTDDSTFPIPSPDGRRILVLAASSEAAVTDRGRLVDDAGRVLWEGRGIVALSGAVWSADGRTVVMAGRPRRWQIVTIDDRGQAHARIVRLPPEAFFPAVVPTGMVSPIAIEPRTIPLGFSDDERWIYGAIVSPELGTLIGQFRMNVEGTIVKPTLTLGVGSPSGLQPQPGTIGGRIVDATTGRIADWHINSDVSGGPPTIEVRNADAGSAFIVRHGTPLGSAWDDNGGLWVLSADSLIYPQATSLDRYDSSGLVGSPVLTTGPIAGASLIGVRDGFAALAITVSRPTVGAQIVLLDLADPAAAAALPLTVEQLGAVAAVSLRP
jgi:hypothetical protein